MTANTVKLTKSERQEIAEVLNTTRVTVTRLLQQFEEEGKMFRYKRRIVLCFPNQTTKK